MNEIILNRAKTCAVSGHRKLNKDINLDKIKETFLELIKDGFDTFLIGMALGFDTICFQILEGIRQTENIKIIACIPCKNQDYNFTKEQHLEYQRMLSSANEILLISEKYTQYCMRKRNDFLVKNSSTLVAYLRQNFGGTYYTVNKAKKENLNIIEI